METIDEVVQCRGCRRVLEGKPYYLGGRAYMPETGEEAKVNFYGGFVCSESCDRRTCIEMESNFPGAGIATRPGQLSGAKIKSNWEEKPNG